MPTVEDPTDYKFKLCQSNQQGKCWRKDKCSRAHNQHELHVWRAEQVIRYPRPIPPPESANHIPRPCEEMKGKKFCGRGQLCFGAHSGVELALWRIRYQKTNQDREMRGESSHYILVNLALPILSIAPAWQTEVEDAVQKAVLHDHKADRLMDIHRECTKISKNHDADLREVVQTAVNALVRLGVSQKERTATGPSTLQHQHHHIPSIG